MRSIIARRLGDKLGAARSGLVKRYLYPLLSSCFALTLMLACNSIPKLAQASASDLSIRLTIQAQYSTLNVTQASEVFIFAFIQVGGQADILSGKLSLACNGVVFDWSAVPILLGASFSRASQPGAPISVSIPTRTGSKRRSQSLFLKNQS